MSEETQNTAVEEAVKEPQVSQDEKKTQKLFHIIVFRS